MPEDQVFPEEKSQHNTESQEVLPITIEPAEIAKASPAKKDQISKELPAQNTVSPNSQPSTEDMEVHHHTHTEHKKWKHYVFEFFMLFLAVFCGFLAEYYLEHRIEADRERQFMVSMIEDLKSDKVMLFENINLRKDRDKLIDSFTLFLSDGNFIHRGNEIYYAGRLLTLPIFFTPNDRTIQQLKFSGGLRLIRNINVSDSIMFYYQQMQQLAFASEDEQRIRGDFRTYAGAIFDGRVFSSMLDKDIGRTIYRPMGNPQLLKKDAASINELIVRAHYIKNVQMAIRNREESIRESAVSLMAFIEKEYHLKEG